jgi:hypothetical protein
LEYVNATFRINKILWGNRDHTKVEGHAIEAPDTSRMTLSFLYGHTNGSSCANGILTRIVQNYLPVNKTLHDLSNWKMFPGLQPVIYASFITTLWSYFDKLYNKINDTNHLGCSVFFV